MNLLFKKLNLENTLMSLIIASNITSLPISRLLKILLNLSENLIK